LRAALVLLVTCFSVTRTANGQQAPTGQLVVFNAGSLAKPFGELLQAFKRRYPDFAPAQENSGSLEAARKLTDLGKIPDVIGVADYGIIPKLLIPKHADWYVTFARNSMVLTYTGKSTGAHEINGRNWWQILLRPGIRVGRSDPVLDPNGYRTLMVLQLAETFYRRPGLAKQLEQAMPPRYMRPKEADLTALVQAGELDYSWSYLSIAKTAGLDYVQLPREVDLSDPSLADWYGHATVRLPSRGASASDSLEFHGEPIVYALTIPLKAPHPATALTFVRFIFSREGQELLKANGFTVLDKPLVSGPGKPPAGLF
jgi:molybdate/tungstate transport system substrate-binding protein